MTKALTHTYSFAAQYSLQLSYALIAVCAVLLCSYAFNVYAVVSHTVALQKIDMQSASVSNTVESLDTQYLGLSSKITPDSLHSYGLSQGQISDYISKTPSLGSVALGGHEL